MYLVQYQFCESCVPSYCPPYCTGPKIPSGSLYLNCEKLKHNGLQDQCKRNKCEKNISCYAAQKGYRSVNCERIKSEIKNNGLEHDCKRTKWKLKKICESCDDY